MHDVAAFDVEAARAWYAARALPWGVRVPAGADFPHGRLLFRKRLMGVRPQGLLPAPDVPGIELRRAGPADLEAALEVDVVAFQSDAAAERPWHEANLAAPDDVEVVLATAAGRPVGTAYCVRSDGLAGPAAYVAGVGVLPEARGRGVAAAMSRWLCARAFDRGARLDTGQPGTGLGLAIVRDVVEIYGGTVELAESEDLGGLLVRLALPRAPA